MAETKKTAKTTKTSKSTTAKKKKPVAAVKKAVAAKTRERDFFSDDDAYFFGQAVHHDVYRKLGAHPSYEDGKEGYFFAVWAPHAKSVSVIGEFNDWDTEADHMTLDNEVGVWTRFIPGVKEYQMYKFFIISPSGEGLYKSDPYANYAEERPGTASKTFDLDHFTWSDDKWMSARKKKNIYKEPMTIYECHIGSWMKHPTEENDGFYSYRDFADRLCEYLKEMPYTHVELMGIAEHPFDGSWGYQVTGYYAPTSRFGNPSDFMYFVNYMHKNGIGVILDWVPAHFPKDAFGLAKFDGTCLYEHFDKRRGEHPDWGTLIYNLERPEVSNFLIANAMYWVEEFHADGIRMDAVASMLYLDYGRKDGEWLPNPFGGRENYDAMEFLKHLNSMMNKRNKNVLMIAEESTAWPNVTGVVEENNSLGFTLKWNMGWMNDFLKYMEQDPLFKKGVHGCLTFSMMYAYSEKFVLVLSHDEVVHGKGSLVNKMPGQYEEKFANLRAAYGFMIGHPGKKLLFMGQDFAQYQEWSEKRELDWYLLDNPDNKAINDWMKDLLHIYRKYPAMYEQDSSWAGFEWINANDSYRSIFSFVRKSKNGKNNLLFVINFTPMAYDDYRVGVPENKKLKLLMNSESTAYNGTEAKRKATYTPEKVECDGREYSVAYPLPAYGVAVFVY